MQNTINERLKILVDVLGTNQNALAVLLGISPSTFRNYTDRTSKPGYEVLEKLYHSFKHINLYWLFGEPGEPLTSSPKGKVFSHSQVIGHVAGAATQNIGQSGDSELRTALALSKQEVEGLKAQLTEKERTIQILLNQLAK